MMSRKKTRRKRRLWKGRSPDKERVPGVEKEEGGGKEVNAYGEQEEEKRELISMIMMICSIMFFHVSNTVTDDSNANLTKEPLQKHCLVTM